MAECGQALGVAKVGADGEVSVDKVDRGDGHGFGHDQTVNGMGGVLDVAEVSGEHWAWPDSKDMEALGTAKQVLEGLDVIKCG